MFDYQAWNRQQQGINPDNALIVSFEWKSEKGPDGEFTNVPYTKIFMDKNTEVIRKTTQEDKERFAERWAAFEKGEERPQDGTPINQVPFATPADISACKSIQIYTVEQLVETADVKVARAYMQGFKYQCQQWLASNKDAHKVAEMAKENLDLKERIKALEEKFRTAGVTTEVEKPKRRGRPRKKVNDDTADAS